MSIISHRVVLGVGSLVIGALLFIGLPAGAQAASAATARPTVTPTTAVRQDFSCGYDGYDGSNGDQPLYNHCGRGNIVIRVHHFFWQTTYACMEPGVHEIPQGRSPWRIIGAEYDGHSCLYPGPLVGP